MLDKHYLLDLQNAGVPVVGQTVIHHSHEALSWDEASQGFTSLFSLAIKPKMSVRPPRTRTG